MQPQFTLIASIAAGFVIAFVVGFGAVRLRLPPWVGYLVAGVVFGRFAPGSLADTELAGQLARQAKGIKFCRLRVSVKRGHATRDPAGAMAMAPTSLVSFLPSPPGRGG